MIDLALIREDPGLVREALTARQYGHESLDRLLQLDDQRRQIIVERDALRAERNRLSKQIAKARQQGHDVQVLMTALPNDGQLKVLEESLQGVEVQIEEILLAMPNIPHTSVPRGPNQNANLEIKRWGTPRCFEEFSPKSHLEIGEKLGILDGPRGVKLAQPRFHVLQGDGEILERALRNFMLDLHTYEHGYTSVWLPHLANEETMRGCGQLPKFGEQLFTCERDKLYLIPTAETNLAGLHAGEILDKEDLPLHYVAYTPCYRREAGAGGQDIQGMIRVHQFDKVELFQYTEAEHSYEALEELTSHAERVLELLGLPYRRMLLCTGDMGFAAAKTYDLEVWLPSQGKYREISSCSNVGDFQARRNRIRYRPGPGAKPRYVHMLNGSGLAVGRTFVAILENYQQANGSVILPEVLQPYMRGKSVIG